MSDRYYDPFTGMPIDPVPVPEQPVYNRWPDEPSAADAYRMGGLAEHVCAGEHVVAKKPTRASFEEAASIPLAALTSLQALREAAGLTAGQRVLIHAAGFNVGLLMRVRYGLRKPRSCSAAACALIFAPVPWLRSVVAAARAIRPVASPRQLVDRWNLALSVA